MAHEQLVKLSVFSWFIGGLASLLVRLMSYLVGYREQVGYISLAVSFFHV